MPAKSILETRIRERLGEARRHEAALVRTLDALDSQVEDIKRGLYLAQNEVALLENLLDPEGGFREHVTDSLKQLHSEEGSPFHPGYVPDGEDGGPGEDGEGASHE